MSPPSEPSPLSAAGDQPLRKGARTKQRIIAVAGELFATRGYEDVGVEEIARGADVAVGTIYKHFGSKQGVLLAFTNEGIDLLAQYLEKAQQAPTPFARVYAAGDAWLQFAEERPVWWRYIAIRVLQPDQNPELAEGRQQLAQRTAELIGKMAADFQQAMEDGEFPQVPLLEHTMLLWATWYGTTMLMVRQDGNALPPELADRMLAHARRMFRHARAHIEAGGEDPGESWPDYDQRQRF